MDQSMLERLETIVKRYDELSQVLMDPSIANDIKKMTEASKEQATLQDAYDLYKEYQKLDQEIKDNQSLLESTDDAEIIEMAEMEVVELKERLAEVEQMTTRTSSWRFGVLQVAMKAIFLPGICSACIRNIVSPKDSK